MLLRPPGRRDVLLLLALGRLALEQRVAIGALFVLQRLCLVLMLGLQLLALVRVRRGVHLLLMPGVHLLTLGSES